MSNKRILFALCRINKELDEGSSDFINSLTEAAGKRELLMFDIKTNCWKAVG